MIDTINKQSNGGMRMIYRSELERLERLIVPEDNFGTFELPSGSVTAMSESAYHYMLMECSHGCESITHESMSSVYGLVLRALLNGANIYLDGIHYCFVGDVLMREGEPSADVGQLMLGVYKYYGTGNSNLLDDAVYLGAYAEGLDYKDVLVRLDSIYSI